jgi:prophage regulatory protein
MAEQPLANYRLLKLPEVERITGKGRTSIYNDPTFPRPVKIGPRASAWVESEVMSWIEARIASRQAQR